jgi:hypothetical protein
MKKCLIAVLLLAAPLLAQSPATDQTEIALNAAGCGPSQVTFDVTSDKNQHPLVQPEAGKAVVYVINLGYQTMKVALDSAWVGVDRGFAYSYFTADPGDHRLCVSQQGDHKQGSATSFAAASGKAYYFQLFFRASTGWDLKPIDPAKGMFLIASSAFSTTHVQK